MTEKKAGMTNRKVAMTERKIAVTGGGLRPDLCKMHRAESVPQFTPKASCKANWLCRSISGPMSTVVIWPWRTTTRPLTMV